MKDLANKLKSQVHDGPPMLRKKGSKELVRNYIMSSMKSFKGTAVLCLKKRILVFMKISSSNIK